MDEEAMRETLYLIDGSALVHRSHFAFIRNPLFNSKGENTSAVFGYVNSLLKILDEHKPSHIAVCFDTPAPTFRHVKFPEYKATREKMDPEMRNQLPMVHEITGALGISIVELDGFEADDVMGTLATKAADQGHPVYLISGDKDFLQLVSEKIKVISPGKMGGDAVTFDEEKVKEKFGVPPEKIVEVLGLAGDKIDNVPGIDGIGIKGATELILDFGSIDTLLAESSRIKKGSVKKKIVQSGKEALTYRELVTIKVDVPVNLDMDALALKKRDAEALRRILKELEFFSLIKKLQVESELEGSYKVVKSEADLPEPGLAGAKVGLSVPGSSNENVDGIAISLGEGECFFVKDSLLQKSARARAWVEELVSSAEVLKAGEDLKKASEYMSLLGIRLRGPLLDTSVASYLLDPDRRDHSLDFLMEREFGLSLPGLDVKSAGGKSEEVGFFDEEQARLACPKADASLKIQEPLNGELKEGGLLSLYENIEAPLILVLAEMEETGVLIDVDFFSKMSGELSGVLANIEEKIYDLAGEKFNINSSKQLANILFDKLGLPWGRKTKTGYSTSQDLLEKLSPVHELPRSILEYRELYKLKSTYVDALPRLVSARTGRIHTTFNQTVTSTGRLSSSDPNLQNIPMRTELGREIRKGFIAGEGNVLLSLDYSQVELRILAHLSGDEDLRKAYLEGEDVHAATAALVFGVKREDVTKEMRDTAKMVNYGLVYGMKPFGLSQRLGISAEKAKDFVDSYFAALPMVKKWIDSTLDSVREKKYTTTLMGRRRYLHDISSTNYSRREFAERAAINSPIQGSAADMIKIAMVNVASELGRMKTKAKMIIQIHDELLFEVPEDDTERIRSMAREKMVNAMKLDVPVEVESGSGRTWFDAH
jgi:DNA polymerase-1